MSLSWCKCYNYGSTKNPGSMWVSENYLGFAFVCKSIFSYVNSIDIDVPFLIDVFWCYNSLICHVMEIGTPTTNTCDKIGAMARLFLSYFYHLDNSIESRNESKIETAACVISVLNISKDIRNKGMQRNYWEDIKSSKVSPLLFDSFILHNWE